MLFEGLYQRNEWPQTGAAYDVWQDGQRFLVASSINVVLNWFEELKRAAHHREHE
jgi:hypothetical protein